MTQIQAQVQAPSVRSIAQAASWTRPDVAAKRSLKEAVMVDGEVYRSTRAAWEALGLPKSKCIPFRQELKLKMSAKYEGHTFEILV